MDEPRACVLCGAPACSDDVYCFECIKRENAIPERIAAARDQAVEELVKAVRALEILETDQSGILAKVFAGAVRDIMSALAHIDAVAGGGDHD